jgi:hypothetical protein
MVTKLILLSLFLVGACGKNVKISTKELESNSRLSDGNSTITNQEGIVKRGTPDLIIVNGSAVKISIYSSYSALEFVAIRPLNSQTMVKFRGKLKNNEMVLEYLEAK